MGLLTTSPDYGKVCVSVKFTARYFDAINIQGSVLKYKIHHVEKEQLTLTQIIQYNIKMKK